MPVQSAEVIGFAQETVYGTFTAPKENKKSTGGTAAARTGFIPGLATINSTTKVARPDQSRGLRDYVVDALVGVEVGATVTTELIPEIVPALIFGWLGTGSDTAGGTEKPGFTHTGVPQNVVPSYSLEVDHDVTSQVLARRLVGCNVDQVVLRGTQQALATAEFTFLGQKEETPASPNEGKPSLATPKMNFQQPIDHSLLTATYSGAEVQELQDYTLTLMNHVQRVFEANKQLYVARLVPTRREVQFQTTLDFLNATMYRDWIEGNWKGGGGTPAFVLKYITAYLVGVGFGNGETEVAGASGKNELEFSLPRLRPMGQYNLQSASDVLNQQITWSTVLGEESAIVKVFVKNATKEAYA
jgi:hypothetical protein